MQDIPLVVDLDGTLLPFDISARSALLFLLQKPWRCLSLLCWFLQARACAKTHLAENVHFDCEKLPFNVDVINFIKSEKTKGREIALATGCSIIYAQQIANYLALFDRCFATQGYQINLIGPNKAEKLSAVYGKKGFDYVGDSRADLAVWAVARKAYLVNTDVKVEEKAKALGNVEWVLHSKRFSFYKNE